MTLKLEKLFLKLTKGSPKMKTLPLVRCILLVTFVVFGLNGLADQSTEETSHVF